jgi:hypothetical protein
LGVNKSAAFELWRGTQVGNLRYSRQGCLRYEEALPDVYQPSGGFSASTLS